jgi:hypothetical protein
MIPKAISEQPKRSEGKGLWHLSEDTNTYSLQVHVCVIW